MCGNRGIMISISFIGSKEKLIACKNLGIDVCIKIIYINASNKRDE